jgi:hypothetical protein
MAALAFHWLNRRLVRNQAIGPAGAGWVGSNDPLDVPDRFSARHAPAFRPKPEVMCKKCGNEWTATSGIVAGPSTFHEVIGDLLLLCSECGMQHVIPESIICENE